MARPIKDRKGEVGYTKYGTKMIIVEYINNANVIIEFQDEHKEKKKCEYKEFLKGKVSNPYDRSVCGVGYIGVGKYNETNNKKEYKEWANLLNRVYNPYELNKCLTYIDVFVEDYFHCFQNYCLWRYENFYEIEGCEMHLDKDILEKGNKIYDREHMIFVPQEINKIFTKRQNRRGELPIGCYKKGNKIIVQCNEGVGKQVYLGTFQLNQIEEAFNCYKNFKENYIKKVADEFKDLIPKKLYEGMYKYKVEIDD